MRYNHRIVFKKISIPARYDPDTGTTSSAVYAYTIVPCELGPLSADRAVKLFGDVTIRAFVVRLQRTYTDEYHEVSVDGRPFEVLRHIDHNAGVGFTGMYLKEVK